MSTRPSSSLLLVFLSLLLASSQLHAQARDAAAQLAAITRHESPDWLTVQPHLPDPATASAAQLEVAGDVLRARRFPEDAVEYYLYALRRGGQEAPLMNKLGVTQLELRNVSIARIYFQRVVRLQRKDARAWNNLGAAEYIDGQLRSAIVDYGRAIKLDGHEASYRSNRATAYFDARDYNRARRDFETAMKLDPLMMEHLGVSGLEVHMLSPSDHARYCFEMARLFAHSGDEDNMLRYLQRASEAGFDVLHEMGSDETFARYRKDPRVLTLVRNAKALRSDQASANVPRDLPALPPENPR